MIRPLRAVKRAGSSTRNKTVSRPSTAQVGGRPRQRSPLIRSDRTTARRARSCSRPGAFERAGTETAGGTGFATWDSAKRLPRAAKSMEGLSLIEVAIALAASALLLGGLMVPLAAQIDRYRLRETEAALAQALEALLGYAASHGNRLPCPDVDGDGVEDLTGSAAAPCRGVEGDLPRATLGVPGLDAWGRRIRYRGNDAYTGPAGVPRPPNTRGRLRIDDPRTAERLTVGDPEAPAAILFSCGANGRPDGANDGTGGGAAGCANPLRPDPRYAHGTPGRAGLGDFDDVLVWMSKNVLLGRLVRAGTWP